MSFLIVEFTREVTLVFLLASLIFYALAFFGQQTPVRYLGSFGVIVLGLMLMLNLNGLIGLLMMFSGIMFLFADEKAK